MDWKKTFNRGQWMIHGIFVITIIFGVGSTLLALKLNNLQNSLEERSAKINDLVTYFKKDMTFDKMGKLLSWAQTDKANDEMKKLVQNLATTEEILEINISKKLSSGLGIFNKLIGQNSEMSNPTDALRLLGRKIESLNEFGKVKKFSRVTHLSQSMENKLRQLNPKNVGTSSLVSYLMSDFKNLESLTTNSSLNSADLNSLKVRLTSIKGDLDLIFNLNQESRNLKDHVNKASIALAEWMIDVEKKASDLQGMRLQKQNQLIIMLAAMVGFIIISWMGLAYLFRWQKQKLSEQIEGEVKNVIEKGILGDQRFMMDHYSDFTREDIIRLLDELKLKLNLGSMLHHGLPFAGCMIDQNFKLTWNNNLFLEQFYLSEEEVRSEAFNWDYLREYLNLESDPVYEALVHKIAGIYPVKIKQDEFAQSQPFEMYVTPINVNREDRVMVFFYPLVSVREAIKEQVDLSRQSIEKFMTHWSQDTLDDDQLGMLEREFKANDLKGTFGTILGLYNKIKSEKEEFIRLINSIGSENESYKMTLSAIENTEIEKKETIREEVNLINRLREVFLSTFRRYESLISINKSILGQNDELKNEAQRLHLMNLSSLKKTKETLEIIGQLDSIKIEYRKFKLELLEVKSKLVSMSQSLLGTYPDPSDPQARLVTRHRDELVRLDFNAQALDKKLSQLDLILSKLAMIYENVPLEQTHFSFLTSQKDHEMKDAIISIHKDQVFDEAKLIEDLRLLQDLVRKDLKQAQNSKTLVNSTLESYLS